MPRSGNEKDFSVMVTMCTIKIILPGCGSLKEKRSLLQPMLSRLHKEFNIAVSEIGLQDVWQSSWIGCVLISNDANHNSQVAHNIVNFIESHFPELQIIEHHLENR